MASRRASILKRTKALLAAAALASTSPAAPLVDHSFPEQAAFIEDQGKLQLLLCTRRAGKSWGAGTRLVRAALKHPGASCLFIALTRESAEKILWKDVLKVINRRSRLGAKFNESKLSMTLPNGSVIYLLGADADEDERQKLLGQKYAEVCIDEAASYSIDLFDLVIGILKPAVADYRGTICLIGTPGNLKHGLFYELTKGQNPREPGTWEIQGWKGHRWSAFQNPHIREKWQAEIDELVAANPLIEKTPSFQQNYWGIWVIDSSKLVYRYEEGRNDFKTLPKLDPSGWHFVLAIDTGFVDATAFTVLQYHDDSRVLFIPESTKEPGLDLTGVAEKAAEIKGRYEIETTVIDGAAKQSVEEMNNRKGLEAVAADKKDKFDFIDIMNDEFIQERIKLGPGAASLKTEYATLIVDERKLKKGKREEHAGCPNHCADTALYGWRWCWQYLYEEPKAPPAKYGTPEYVVEQQQREQEQIEAAWQQQMDANLKQKLEQQEADSWL